MSPTKVIGFFSDRWQAKVNFRRLFWLDMLAVGTLINLFSSFAALLLMALLKEATAAMLLHFSTLPPSSLLCLL